MEKTNAMRILDRMSLPYEARTYPHSDVAQDAETVAQLLGVPADTVYKTLVLMGSDKACYVCVIPGSLELDLKKAAAGFQIKSLRMLHVDELKPITGYIRGGCSPIGMKKQLKTLVDASARECARIYVSAGQIGSQIALDPKNLLKATGASFAPLTPTNEKGEIR